MASKEATKSEPAATTEDSKGEETKKEAAPSFAFEFKISKANVGEKTTQQQVKSKVREAFQGWGTLDETRLIGGVGADRTVTVIFSPRLFAKGQPAWDALSRGEKPTLEIYGETVELAASDAKPSGGGAATGTAMKPKKEVPKKDAAKGEGKRGGGRGRGRGEGKDGDGKEGKDGKDGEGKDGEGRGRGRGRGKKEEAKVSLQRGRANIGGKLGQPSKLQLAKAERAKKAAERKARIDRGEDVPPEEEEKKEEEKKEEAPKEEEKKGKKGGKAEGGKKDGKAEGGKKDGKKDGKAEGKKDGGKKEGKAEGKKEAGKKGKGA